MSRFCRATRQRRSPDTLRPSHVPSVEPVSTENTRLGDLTCIGLRPGPLLLLLVQGEQGHVGDLHNLETHTCGPKADGQKTDTK